MPKKVEIKSDNEILNNIFRLLSVKGVRQKDLASYLDISKTVITQWKLGTTTSYMNNIDQLATFFGVSKDEILYPDKALLHDSLLSPEEMDIIRKYRELNNTELQKLLVSHITTLVNYFTNGTCQKA